MYKFAFKIKVANQESVFLNLRILKWLGFKYK